MMRKAESDVGKDEKCSRVPEICEEELVISAGRHALGPKLSSIGGDGVVKRKRK